ncbi:MAG: GTP cyclohydrolase [Gammaproteobacteria bacterium]|nr:GTP cyclohydrolase [Gammaproteobacteria bacterium]
MFVILVKYTKNLAVVDQYLASHRDYLETGYQKGYLMASGPQKPRTGGVLISQLKDRKILDAFLQHDPFYLQDVASYQVVEFTPVKFHQLLSSFVN